MDVIIIIFIKENHDILKVILTIKDKTNIRWYSNKYLALN